MKNIIIVLVLLAILIIALNGAKKRVKGGCCGGSKPKKVKPQTADTANYTYKATVHIDGMACERCKERVENAFGALPDCYAQVNLKEKCATIWSNEKINEEEIADIVKKNGYTFVKFSQE